MLHPNSHYLLRLYPTLIGLNSFGTCLYFWPHYIPWQWVPLLNYVLWEKVLPLRKPLIFVAGSSFSHCEKPQKVVPCTCSPCHSLLHISNNPFSDTLFKLKNHVLSMSLYSSQLSLLPSPSFTGISDMEWSCWHTILKIYLENILQDLSTMSSKMFF